MKLKPIVKDKRGVAGLDTAKAFMLTLFTLAIVGFALLIAMSSLNNSDAGTNATQSVLNNVSDGVTSFFGDATTWLALLSVVVIILIISIVIFAVNRFGGNGGEGI